MDRCGVGGVRWSAMTTDADLAEAGRAAVAEGLRLWHLDIIDPAPRDLAAGNKRALECRKHIDAIITAAGWGFDTPYAGNRVGREWCGFFAAACWRAAGLDPRWLAPFFASTLRLASWVRYRPWNRYENPAPPVGWMRRRIAKLDRSSTASSLPFVPREGDIAIIGTGTPAEGAHITLVTGIDSERNVLRTVEGNGVGNGPDGKPREGVVVAERRIGGPGSIVLWIYRPAPSDLEPMVG